MRHFGLKGRFMEYKRKQVGPGTSHGDNPLANRFENQPPKIQGRFPRVAYVLQGGGALGAYQFGVVKGLLEAGYEPDWIAATSIGAIQAAIIVGNHPEQRAEKLAQFWHKISPPRAFDFLGESPATIDLYNELCAASALMFGQPDFFFPRWGAGAAFVPSDPTLLSYYDTSPLRDTLLELVDFDLLNASPIRLSLGAAHVNTGHLIYFNNIHYLIKPEHVMASAALPPGFPAVNVDGEPYWDGGVHSNTPLEVILEAIPPENTLCFLIDCFGGKPMTPTSMYEVMEHAKDISYSTHAHRTILNYLLRQKMRNAMLEVSKILTEDQRKKHADLLDIGTPHHCTLVRVNYSARFVKAASKDYNFGRMIIDKRIEIGYKDSQALLADELQWGYLPEDMKSRLYECKNNKSEFIRKPKSK